MAPIIKKAESGAPESFKIRKLCILKRAEYCYAERRYAGVIMLSIVMLSVMAPFLRIRVQMFQLTPVRLRF
jgi:hypothetical protein